MLSKASGSRDSRMLDQVGGGRIAVGKAFGGKLNCFARTDEDPLDRHRDTRRSAAVRMRDIDKVTVVH